MVKLKSVGWFSSESRYYQTKVSIESYHAHHGHDDTHYYLLFCGSLRELSRLSIPEYVEVVFLSQMHPFYVANAAQIGDMGGFPRTLIIDHMLRMGHQKVLCLDGDMETFASLDDLWTALDMVEAIVTPHRLVPPPWDGKRVTQELFVFYGNYNSAFTMFRNSAPVRAFVEWWNVMSMLRGGMDFQAGQCAEQGWLRFIADYLPGTLILRDPGVNFAFWRYDREDMLTWDGQRWLVEGVPLRVFHYSNFDHDDLPESIERHQNRAKCSPEMLRFLEEYDRKIYPLSISQSLSDASLSEASFLSTGGGIVDGLAGP